MLSKRFVLVLFTFSFTSNIFCIKNDTNSEIKFSLVDSIDSEYVKGHKNQYYIRSQTEITLECLSKYPIKIIFSGVMPHGIKYTEIEWNKTTDFYKVSIAFKNTPAATGPYVCEFVEKAAQNSTTSSTIYIFADNGTELFLLNWKTDDNFTKVCETKKKILIPCITFNPNSTPVLSSGKKHNATYSKFSVVSKKMFRYENTKGFLVDNPNPIDTMYQCAVSNNPNTPKLTFRMRETNCKFTPTGSVNVLNEIYCSDNITISLTCESIDPVNIKKNNRKLLGKATSHGHFYYKYIAIANITSCDIHDYITCGTTNNENIVHKWTFVKKSHTRPKVRYSREKNIFYCNDSSKDYEITMAKVNCHNLANCEVARRFDPSMATRFSENENKYPYLFNNESNLAGATIKQFLGIPENDNCAIIDPTLDINLGMVYCLIRKIDSDKSKKFTKFVTTTMQYFADLNDQIVEEMNFGNLTDVLRMPLYNNTKFVDVGDSLKFRCEASIFVFAKGLVFHFLSKDGTSFPIPEDLLQERVVQISNSNITLDATITFPVENITAVECRALKWKEKDWMTVKQSIRVTGVDDAKPLISVENFPDNGGDIKMDILISDLPKNITCRATGFPLPKIRWDRLDWESDHIVPNMLSNENTDSENTTTSILMFPKLKEAFYKYVCIATSDGGGETKRTFMIKISKSNSATASNNAGIEHWIIYPITAAIILFLLALVLFLWRMLRVKQNQIELTEAEILSFMNGDEDLVKKYQELHEVARYLPYKQHYEIHPSKIETKNDVLGTGQCGIVMKGILQKSGKQIPIAVKTVKSGSGINNLRMLLSEIKIMMYIGNHPHIIELLGAVTTNLREGKLSVAVEYCSNGNLQSYLRLCRPTFQNQIVNDEITDKIVEAVKVTGDTRRFTGKSVMGNRRNKNLAMPSHLKTTNLITWCYQVASGMEYLATKKVIHGDLAARNLLITETLSVKITDFGLARHLYDYTNYVTKQKNEPLPWRWLSIEAIKDSKFSTKSDVWAYGVTLWEIFSLGGIPYQGFSWGEEFVRNLSGGYRMGKAQYATDDIHNTMLECWNTSAKDRPSFQDISNNFKELMEKLDVWTDNMVATNFEDISLSCLTSEMEEQSEYINDSLNGNNK